MLWVKSLNRTAFRVIETLRNAASGLSFGLADARRRCAPQRTRFDGKGVQAASIVRSSISAGLAPGHKIGKRTSVAVPHCVPASGYQLPRRVCHTIFHRSVWRRSARSPASFGRSIPMRLPSLKGHTLCFSLSLSLELRENESV